MEFVKFGSIPRLYREITITEKIDGANAVIGISDDEIKVGTRSNWLEGTEDFHGLKAWVMDNADSLRADLGNGLHRGEWYGKKINRAYGLDHHKFALFNTSKWVASKLKTENLTVVPTLYIGAFSDRVVHDYIHSLKYHGSVLERGFYNPEGIVIYHKAANHYFKVLCKNDHLPKSLTHEQD